MRRKKRSGRVWIWALLGIAVSIFLWLWLGPEPHQTSRKIIPPLGGQPPSATPDQAAPSPRGSISTSAPPTVLVKTQPAQIDRPKESMRDEPASSTGQGLATNAVSTDRNRYPRFAQNTFEIQVALARQALSPGSIDGQNGNQTRSALVVFQKRERLPLTGQFDKATRMKLLLTQPATRLYLVTSNDLARLQPLSPTWLGKSQQTALEYETVLEYLAEKAKASPHLLQRLNSKIDWTSVAADQAIDLPDVVYPQPANRAAFISISLADKLLEAWDEQTNLLAHFPCSIARKVEKRPIGELHVAVLAPNPNYTFDPEIFPESPEAKQLTTKLVLPPGPNNPVGVAWIGLDKPGYGIHGTPNPEQVGRTESHGCFRLANWNAEYLLQLVQVGTPVYVQP